MCVKQTSTSGAQFPYDGLVQWSYVLHYAIDFSIVIFSGKSNFALIKIEVN